METTENLQEILKRIKLKRNTTSKSTMMTTSCQTKKSEEQNKNYSSCPLCGGLGWIITPRENAQPLFTPCKCQEEEKIKRLWLNSGINSENIDKTFTNFESWNDKVDKIKKKAISYYQNFEAIKGSRHNSIMLCGNPGSGKTHLCLALANNFLKKNHKKVVYMPYRDIITKIKQNILDEEFYKKTISKYQTCEILLIDDLFKGKVNETDINIMFELINYRYLNYLPIIVSTEYTLEKLLSFDESIGSRIYEMSKDYVSEIEGIENNYRLR